MREDALGCSSWKDKIAGIWERVQYIVRAVKVNGTIHWPDGNGVVDLGEIETEDMEVQTTGGVNAWTQQNPVTLKDFVNSSIATNTANYISDNGEPFTDAVDLPTTGVTNNDYAFVTGTDAAGNTYYDRYKYSAATGTWALEYRLNNSSFTAEQWSAINSGITSGKVTTYDGYDSRITSLGTQINNKQVKHFLHNATFNDPANLFTLGADGLYHYSYESNMFVISGYDPNDIYQISPMTAYIDDTTKVGCRVLSVTYNANETALVFDVAITKLTADTIGITILAWMA